VTAGRGTGTPPAVVAALGALAITGLVVGTWALLAPGHFFHQFPLGQGWVATDGPYNEHLVRDVGALNLALGIATAISLGVRSVHAQHALAWGWAVDGVAHLVYHLHHLGPFETATAVAVAVITASTPALAAAALVSLHGEQHRDRSAGAVRAHPR
jgi:hypothetical protein